MKTLKTQIPCHHLRTFQFYANHFGISVEVLLQRELYGQATTLTDDVFPVLEWLDELDTTEDLEPITLSFANESLALLSRVSQLLRRPLGELSQGLLSSSAVILASMIAEALQQDGMDCDRELPGFAKEAVLFDLAAKRERLPLDRNGFSCWTHFIIKKPQRKAKAGKSGIRSSKICAGGAA